MRALVIVVVAFLFGSMAQGQAVSPLFCSGLHGDSGAAAGHLRGGNFEFGPDGGWSWTTALTRTMLRWRA